MNRGRRGRGAAGGVRRQVNLLKSAMHGHQNRLRLVAPPPFNESPYNSLTISQRIKGGAGLYEFVVKDVCTYLLTQFGLPNAQIVALVDYVSIKLKRVDVYAAARGSSTENPALNCTFYSLSPTVNDATTETVYPRMKRLTDTGNLSRNAVVSYSWPTHMADTPLDAAADFAVVSVTTNLEDSALVRFHVQWAFNGIV